MYIGLDIASIDKVSRLKSTYSHTTHIYIPCWASQQICTLSILYTLSVLELHVRMSVEYVGAIANLKEGGTVDAVRW